MSMSLVFLAYLVGSALFSKNKESYRDTPQDELREVQRFEKKLSGGKKTSVAMSINSKLMKLHTAEEVLGYALEMLDHTDVVNLVTAIHRSAKLSLATGKVSDTRNNPKLLAVVTQLAESLTGDVPISVQTRAVGNTSWALAKIGARQAWNEVVGVLHDIFCLQTEHFKPEELMNAVWAFSEISKSGDKVVEARAVAVAVALGRFDVAFDKLHLQQVVYFAWALGRLSQIGMVRSSEDAQASIQRYTVRIINHVTAEGENLTTKNLSMLAWALTNLGRTSKRGFDLDDDADKGETVPGLVSVLHLLGDQSLRIGLATFAPGEVASVCWALAKSKVGHEKFFETYANHLMRNGLKGYGYQDLSNILCAYVNAHCGSEPFFDMLCTEVSRHSAGFNRIEKTMVNTALLKLSRPQLPPSPQRTQPAP